MSLASYIIRTMFVVIPGTAAIGIAICLANGIRGGAFWWTLAATLLFGAVVGLISSTLNYRRFVAPIAVINEHLGKMRDGDLTARVPLGSVQQLRPIAASLNEMAGAWQEVMGCIQHHAEEVAQCSAQLAAVAEQTSKATEQIAATMETLASQAEEQAGTARGTAAAVNDIFRTLADVAHHTKAVSQSARETAAKAEAGKQSVAQMSEQMHFIYDHVQSLGQVVKGLGERSNEIGQITEAITGIASQTNLLALNAAIEAARAGEQGKGFAVVAGEVRKLAEQSARSAQQISKLIGYIQEETKRAIASTEQVVAEVEQGLDAVSAADQSFAHIREAVDQVNKQIGQVSAAIEQMAGHARQVDDALQQMTDIVEQSADGAANVSAATQEQMASVEEIASSSTSLGRMAEQMKAMLKQFLV
ncbi:methyl-accepting chemotaxis protein [Geobacillus jurassicus]|uniref:Methyl-accepting chemotaxis protein n=1 Tax=Geobacillus jurassicus TaxID=235932 RepID=A0ABV6GQS4_9BACL|nr:methyl-accepting chemotaxis protein [Geobacillus jurassicus]